MKMGSNKKARVLEGGVFGSGRVGNFGVESLAEMKQIALILHHISGCLHPDFRIISTFMS